MKKVTMSDIASKAGISRQTVSDIMNKRNVIKVSDQTREKVWNLAKDLNYQPNYLSRSLKKGKTNIICVATTGGTLDMFDNMYTAKVYNGIGRHFFYTDYKLLFQNINQEENAHQMLDLITSRLVDGMVVVLYLLKGQVRIQPTPFGKGTGLLLALATILLVGLAGLAPGEFLGLFEAVRRLVTILLALSVLHAVAVGVIMIAAVAIDILRRRSKIAAS